MPIPPLYKHQKKTISFLKKNQRVLDFSDPGTGKTRSHILDTLNTNKKTLVFAPKTILYPAWGADIEKFAPNIRYIIANASNRTKAFSMDADIYITNHDAATWVNKHPDMLSEFGNLIIDESTAFKHRGSLRAKAMLSIAKHFDTRRLLTGTPTSNGILDIWHQALLCDDGARLGTNFWKFRSSVCEPVQTGPGASMLKWVDKEGIEDVIGLLIQDITIRHKFEECIDIPKNTVRRITFTLPESLKRKYKTLQNEAIIQLSNTTTATAIHKAALATKLLQLASGAVYDASHTSHVLYTERYELVAQLVAQRPHSIIAFNWTHQRNELARLLDRDNISYGIIDGTASNDDRKATVNAFQRGELRTILAHPQSAGHGLTLTKGTATIWASPTHNAEHFKQFNKRIYRAGQTQETETILVEALDTLEHSVYTTLNKKISKMDDLLTLLQE